MYYRLLSGDRLVLLAGLLAIPLCLGTCGGDSDAVVGDGGGDGSGTARACLIPKDCDDDNPCTRNLCDETLHCQNPLAPDGDAEEQVEGDCQRTTCKDGQALQVPDSGDVADDREVCTLDLCGDGGAQHVPQLDGSECEVGRGSGTCQQGRCIVLCTAANADRQCDDLNNCTEDACLPCDDLERCGAQGQCSHSGLSGIATPDAVQIPGDCREHRCVEGVDTHAEDNFDTPDDDEECTEDICKEGTPAHPPLAARTACAEGTMICDGAGRCVTCITADDCPPSTEFCRQPACEEGSCTTVYVDEGTALPDDEQTVGDCRKLVCNGSGYATYEVDDGDVRDDNNDCTEDTCVSGSRRNDPLPQGTECGNPGQICDTYGRCCTPTTCEARNYECGSLSDGCGTTLDCGPCPGDTDICRYGQCCTPATCAGRNYVCGSLYDGCGTTLDCGPCRPGDSCVSGQCRCANGTKDYNEGDVDCGANCPDLCTQGKTCRVPEDCDTGFCVDGVCCEGLCTGLCLACSQAKTGETSGTCTNVAVGTDPDYECSYQSPSTCGQTGNCGASGCELYPSGETCVTQRCVGSTLSLADTCDGQGTCDDNGSQPCPDGYACLNSSECQSCSDGYRNGAETDVDCGGGAPCAKCGQGLRCSVPSDCLSDNCVDGYCCNNPCSELCRRCDLSGSRGVCSFTPAGLDLDGECPGQKTCDGAGGCS